MDTLANGAVRVSNPETGQWEDDSWRLVEDLRLGAVDSPASQVFGRIASFAVDELGRTWVLDDQAREVRVFDSEGGYVGTVGRRGDGPGEFARPHAVLSHPNGTMWVVDPPARRYSVFDASGTFLTSYPREMRSSTQPRSEGFDLQGHLVEMVGAFRDGKSEYRLVRLNPAAGVVVDALAIPKFEEELFETVVPQDGGGIARYSSRVPFTPYLTWTTDPRGYLWHGATAPYRIFKQSFSGDTVLVIERQYAPVQVSAAERTDAIGGLSQLREMGASISESSVPGTKPAFEFLVVDDAGFLWVQPIVENRAPTDGTVITDFDVFNATGVYLGRLASPTALITNPAPPGRVAPVIRGNHIYGVHADSLGVHYLVRLSIEGR